MMGRFTDGESGSLVIKLLGLLRESNLEVTAIIETLLLFVSGENPEKLLFGEFVG